MDIFKEIQNEESNKGSLVHNWHCQELEHFITELIKKDRTEQLLIHSVVSSKRFKEQDLINGYQAGAIEQKGINPDVVNLEYLKKLQSESDKWLKRYTE